MKKKILFTNGHLNAGGVEKSLVDVLANFDYDKYDVDLLLFEELGDYACDIPPQVNVRLVDLHPTYGSLPKVLMRCAKQRDWFSAKMRLMLSFDARLLKHTRNMLFGNKRYDIAIGFRPGVCTNVVAFAVDADKKLTWWHHGQYNLDSSAERDYIHACRKIDRVVAVSQSCCEFLAKHIPELADKLRVIPNLLQTDIIREKSEQFCPYEKDGRRHLVSVGRLSPEKHMENCIYAAANLRDRGITDFVWHIIGDGAQREKLEALAAELDVGGFLCFEGSRPNPYPYLRQADLFVHPSYVESHGIAILEAMALGVPCVVTRSLGPCEFISDGVNGLLTDQNPDSLTERVLAMLTNRTLYDTIKGNTHCPEQFLPSKVIDQIFALLQE